MSEEGQPSRERLDKLARERRLRDVFENTLPALFGILTVELRKLRDLIPPDDRRFGQNIVLDEDIKFLERLDVEELKNKVLRELAEGNDLLAVSLLTFVVIRAHLSIVKMERELKEADRAKRGLSKGGKEFFDLIREEQINTESALLGLLERSSTLGKRYGTGDLWEFIRESERILTDAERDGIKLKRVRNEKEILGRVLKKEFQEGDEERLQSIIDQRIGDGLSLVELNTIGALQEKPGVLDQLRINIQELLRLYQIRRLVGETIPEEVAVVKK